MSVTATDKHGRRWPVTSEFNVTQERNGQLLITEMSRQELIGLGARFRANRLIEQSGYTLALAALENTGVANLFHTLAGGTPTSSGTRRRVLLSAAMPALARHERARQARPLPLHGDGDRRRLTSAWTSHSRFPRVSDRPRRAATPAFDNVAIAPILRSGE